MVGLLVATLYADEWPDALRFFLASRLHQLRASDDGVFAERQPKVWRPLAQGRPAEALARVLREEVVAQPALLSEWAQEHPGEELGPALDGLAHRSSLRRLPAPDRFTLAAPDGMLELSLEPRLVQKPSATAAWPGAVRPWHFRVAGEGEAFVVLGRALHCLGFQDDYTQRSGQIWLGAGSWRSLVGPLDQSLDQQLPLRLDWPLEAQPTLVIDGSNRTLRLHQAPEPGVPELRIGVGLELLDVLATAAAAYLNSL